MSTKAILTIASAPAAQSAHFARAALDASMPSDPAWLEIARSLKLSRRELQIIQGIFDNLTECALASALAVSEHTVHGHLNRLYRKLQVSTRSQLVVRVMRELHLLTVADGSRLPPICAHRANGRCPRQAAAH